MSGIWAKGLADVKNSNVSFFKFFDKAEEGEISIAGGSCYQIFCDGKLLAFGPTRACHGVSRIQKLNFSGKNLVIIIAGYNIKTYWLLNEPPFFMCDITLKSGKKLNHNDFTCCNLSDRVQKVQRYSFQRAFIESYQFSDTRREQLLSGKCNYTILETQQSKNTNKIIESYTSLPKLEIFRAQNIIEHGGVKINNGKKAWRDRAHYNESYVDAGVAVYGIDEWEDFATDEVCKMDFTAEKIKGKEFFTYDFGRAITGFLNFKAKVKANTTIYIVYDELIWYEEKDVDHTTKNVSVYRNTCSNVFKYQFLTDGEFCPLTLEPYAMRYVKVIVIGDAEVSDINITDFSNPDVNKFSFDIADKEVNAIMAAAVSTLAQNAVDLLTDCPSRERAGWLSDSYFSSVAEKLFTGKNIVEESFLQNYAMMEHEPFLPENMIPMSYPSDNYDHIFIPNWSMWYILELHKYFNTYGKTEVIAAAKSKVFGLIKYFDGFTNELGLLENLESWVFVEWSEANNPDHIAGVNTASNICWSRCLICIGEMFNDDALTARGKKIQETILNLSYDGELFVDNLIRIDGKLTKTQLKTEVCQYYAFWFNAATKLFYPKLYDLLMNKLGINRLEGFRQDIGKPNAMYGIYMRLDLLERDGDIKTLYAECKNYFYKMAARTGTLWEHNDISASTIHGFAAYAAKWIIFALTGYLNGNFSDEFIGVDCSFTLPNPNGYVKVKIKDNKRTISK